MPEITTTLLIQFGEQPLAEQYYSCLEPELKDMPQGRATTTYSAPENGNLEFQITARDFTAARAAYNALILALRVIDETIAISSNPSR